MEYLINDCILFSPANKRLHSITDENVFVELSNTATRLLVKFIDSNSILLTREELFKNVWSDYGFTYSYSALSNHVSEIRKAFITLEHNLEVLTTVPRAGFKFDAKIDQPPQKNERENPQPHDAELTEGTKKSSIFKQLKEKSALVLTISFFTFSALLLLLTLLYVYFFNKGNEVHFIKTFKKCDIYQVAYSATLTDEKAINLVQSNKIDCTHSRIDVFYSESDESSDEFGIKIVSSCKEKDSTCTNYIYNNRY
jgi:DNA-binding winged helix-turn-helix (wHTH) protein